MWKKLWIMCIALIGLITTGYAFTNEGHALQAASSGFAIPKGAKVILGTYKGKDD